MSILKATVIGTPVNADYMASAVLKRGKAAFTVPADTISITRSSDMIMTRALDNSYSIATFGESPVDIQVFGVAFPEVSGLAGALDTGITGSVGNPVDPYSLIRSVWYITAYGETYKCILTSCTIETKPPAGMPPMSSTYRLVLKGIRIEDETGDDGDGDDEEEAEDEGLEVPRAPDNTIPAVGVGVDMREG